MKRFFVALSNQTAQWTGSPWSFLAAVLVCLVWIGTGPYYQFSDTWQLVINTGTTIITFLMVFLIQNTQNRDKRALHLKLDELIYAVAAARNEMIDIECLNDDELKELATQFRELRKRCQEKKRRDAAWTEDGRSPKETTSGS
jgi:low affinity Fe/Cu permease